MRHLTLICIIILIGGCNSTKKEKIIASENDMKQSGIAFSELEQILKNDGGRLWNHNLYGPILLINRETRIIYANEQDELGELKKQGALFIGKFPENRNIGNSVTEWNGKLWAMVGFPLREIKEDRLSELIHESFHRIQFEIGFDSLSEKQNSHLDTKEGRIFLKLEMEALKKALQSENPEAHIKNALLFRHYRQQLFPGSDISENSLEINEGIAEYTGSILCGMNNSDLQKHYSAQIDLFFTMPTFVRSFAYFTIPIYGYYMKHKDYYWNQKITRETNLTKFISGFFNVSYTKSDPEKVLIIGKSYNLDSISKFEEKREGIRLGLIKKYKAQFLGDSVLTIMLEKMEIAFNAKNAMPLDSFGTVYPNLRITDNWGILDVDSCSALVSPDWNFVTISYPKRISDSLITGEGWKLKLNKGWKLEKKNLKYILTK